MTDPEKAGRKLGEVLGKLSSLRGVRNAFYLTKPLIHELARIEKEYPSFGPLTVRNDGLKECLKRSHVACIIKDKHFRPPPVPTVLLVDDDGMVIGQELLPGDKPPTKKGLQTFMLGKDFVIFYEKGKGKGAKFILPPVPFCEIEEMEGVAEVCSSSPSTTGDFYLRKCYGIEDDPKLASILIGFEVR